MHTFVIEHDYEYKKAIFLLLRESVRLQVVTLDQVYSLLKESKSIDGAWKYYILTQFESDENKDALEELLETIFLLPCLENKDIFLSMYMINSSLHSSDSLFIKKYINVLLEILALKDMTIYEWNVMMKSFYSMEESWQEYRSNLAEMYEVFLQFQPDVESLAYMSKTLTTLFSLENDTHKLSNTCRDYFIRLLSFKEVTLQDQNSFLKGIYLLALKDDIQPDTIQSVFDFINDAADIPIMEGKDLNLFGLFL